MTSPTPPTRGPKSSILSRALWVAALVGCGGAQPEPATGTAATPQPRPTPTLAAAPGFATEATLLEAACDPGAPERCNGVDDNCNGQLDEGCPDLPGGSLRVVATMLAATTAVQLRIIAPSGDVLEAPAALPPTCGTTRDDRSVWLGTTPAEQGTYRVELLAGPACDEASAAITLTTSIQVGDRVFGPVNVTLTPETRVELATLAFQ